MKSIQKHIKIVNSPQCIKPCKTINSIHKICSSTHSFIDNEITPIDKHIVFTLNKGTRSLKSINENNKVKEQINDINNNLNKDRKNAIDGGINFLMTIPNWFKRPNPSGSKNSDDLKKIIGDKNQQSP